MQHFRRSPLYLRITSLVGLLCSLTSLVLIGWMHFTLPRPYPAIPFQHTMTIALSLLALGGAFQIPAISSSVSASVSRELSPGVQAVPARTWRSQVWPIALLAALPTCALALALFVPLSLSAYSIPNTLLLVALGGELVAVFWSILWGAISAQRQNAR